MLGDETHLQQNSETAFASHRIQQQRDPMDFGGATVSKATQQSAGAHADLHVPLQQLQFLDWITYHFGQIWEDGNAFSHSIRKSC